MSEANNHLQHYCHGIRSRNSDGQVNCVTIEAVLFRIHSHSVPGVWIWLRGCRCDHNRNCDATVCSRHSIFHLRDMLSEVCLLWWNISHWMMAECSVWLPASRRSISTATWYTVPLSQSSPMGLDALIFSTLTLRSAGSRPYKGAELLHWMEWKLPWILQQLIKETHRCLIDGFCSRRHESDTWAQCSPTSSWRRR